MIHGQRRPRVEEPSLPAVQAEVARWVSKVTEMADRLGPHVARAESRQRALAYGRGLLRPSERQNGGQLAEPAGERHPDHFQPRLNRATWRAEAVRDDLRQDGSASLGDPQAVLVVDETGFLKTGRKSAGVARQDLGTAGTIDHGQSGVFLAYARPTGRTGDAVDGHDRKWRRWLASGPQASVLAVPATEPVWQGFRPLRVQALLAPLVADAWQRLRAGDGAQGPRLYDWALVPRNPPLTPGWLNRRQWSQKRLRCQARTVQGWTEWSAPRHPAQRRASQAQSKRSVVWIRGLGTDRW
jgi:hypothetical protein